MSQMLILILMQKRWNPVNSFKKSCFNMKASVLKQIPYKETGRKCYRWTCLYKSFGLYTQDSFISKERHISDKSYSLVCYLFIAKVLKDVNPCELMTKYRVQSQRNGYFLHRKVLYTSPSLHTIHTHPNPISLIAPRWYICLRRVILGDQLLLLQWTLRQSFTTPC